MVAMAILAMGLMALSDVVGGALRNHVRAAHLDQATLLARGKLVEVEEEFEQKGFRDFDQTDEGNFEDQGHREIRWKVEAVKPQVELGPDRILQMLTGGKGIEAMLGSQGVQALTGGQGAAGQQTLDPRSGALTGLLQGPLTQIGEQIKKGVREVRLTVSWPEGAREESFTVVTHLVVLQPKELTQ
jgi:general secretion pathway protein I